MPTKKPIKFIELDPHTDSYIFQYADSVEVEREVIPLGLKVYIWMGMIAWVISVILTFAEQKLGYFLFAGLFPLVFAVSYLKKVLVVDLTAYTMQIQYRLGSLVLRKEKSYEVLYKKLTLHIVVREAKHFYTVHCLKIDDKIVWEFSTEYDFNAFMKLLGEKITITDMEMDVSKK